MNASLNDFEKRITEIKAHIQTLKDAQDMIAQTKAVVTAPSITGPLNRIVARRNEEKEFEYRANIISLYGAFEQFVEDLIREYVGEISRICVAYEKLDDKIKKGYVEKWKGLHTNIVKGHAKYTLSEMQMAQNMNITLIQNSSAIMPECFIPIGGNYRHNVVCECMEDIGAVNIKSGLRKYEPLQTILVPYGDDNDRINQVLNLKIADLVERRNEVAHGAVGIMLGDDDYEKLLNFIVTYSQAVNAYMNDELLRVEWEVNDTAMVFMPTRRFHGNTVAVFTVIHVTIKKGRRVLIKNPDGIYPRFRQIKVANLHVEQADGGSTEVDEVAATKPTIISIDCVEAVSAACNFKFL